MPDCKYDLIALVVDDEPQVIEYLTEALEPQGVYVISYLHGKRAVAGIKNNLIYDILIVDVSLSDISGLEVICASRETNPCVPVVAISGYDHGKISGADRFVQKNSEVYRSLGPSLRQLCPTFLVEGNRSKIKDKMDLRPEC